VIVALSEFCTARNKSRPGKTRQDKTRQDEMDCSFARQLSAWSHVLLVLVLVLVLLVLLRLRLLVLVLLLLLLARAEEGLLPLALLLLTSLTTHAASTSTHKERNAIANQYASVSSSPVTTAAAAPPPAEAPPPLLLLGLSSWTRTCRQEGDNDNTRDQLIVLSGRMLRRLIVLSGSYRWRQVIVLSGSDNQSIESHLANIHGDRVGGKSLLPVRRRDGVDVLFQFKKRNPLFERFLSLWWSRACLGRTMAFLVQNGIAKEAGSYLQHRRVVRQRLQCDVQHTKRTPS
jgi:hypothetical protein